MEDIINLHSNIFKLIQVSYTLDKINILIYILIYLN